MKFFCLKLTTVCSILLASFASQAQVNVDGSSALPVNAHRLISITADYYPGEIYHLGYTTNPDNSIKSIFYENHEHKITYFSFEKLTKYQTIITNVTGGKVYKLVELRGEEAAPGVYHIEMRYMKNGLFKNHDEANFNVFYVPSHKSYVILDADHNQLINKCSVTTNYWGSTAVGIGKIISSK